MAVPTPKSVRRAIERGDLAPVYYLTGDEEILKDELVDMIVNAAVDSSARDFNVDLRSAGDLDAESLHALVETPPMLAERRVAVVRNLEQWRKNSKPWVTLKRYLEQPSPTTTLVLVHGTGQAADKAVLEHATHVKLDAPGAESLKSWILEHAEQDGLSIDAQAAEHLVEAVGQSLSQISSELKKLGAASKDGSISVRDVESMVGVRHGETLSDWVDAAAKREIPRAVSLLDIVMQQPGVTGVKMLATLGTSIIGVRMARAMVDEGKGSKAVQQAILDKLFKARPRVGRYSDVASQWTTASRNWNGSELDRALRLVWEADTQLKSTTISNARGTISSMLLQFSKTEREGG